MDDPDIQRERRFPARVVLFDSLIVISHFGIPGGLAD